MTRGPCPDRGGLAEPLARPAFQKMEDLEMHRVAVALSIVLVGWSKVLAYFVARDALVGSPFGPWSSDPVVLWGELILAACGGLLSVVAARFIIRRFRAGSAGSAGTKLAIGLGFLAVGALGIAVGWLGLRVPTTPGSDFLERGEPLFIIDGVIAGAFGLLVVWSDAPLRSE